MNVAPRSQIKLNGRVCGPAADFDVVIIGAGVGGAACALAFAHSHRLNILVIERHHGPGNLDRGGSLLPPVTALFKRWNILDECLAAGARQVKHMQFHHHRRGLLLEVPLSLPTVTDPYLVLRHPEVERVIVGGALATGRVEVWYQTRFTSLIEECGRVCGAVVDRAGTEKRLRARVIVGADGAGSVVRTALGIEMLRSPYDHCLFTVDVDRPDGLPDVLRTEIHPSGGVLVVPGAGRLGVGALVRRSQEHQFRSGSLEEKFAQVEKRSPFLAGRRPSQGGSHLYKLWRGHAPRYSARGAVLIGDAIHVLNPVMAQGMTMAIEDSAALARHLGPALAAGVAGNELDTFFAAYECERRPHNATIVRRSHMVSRVFTLGGPFSDIVHRTICGVASSPPGQFFVRRVWSSFAKTPEPLPG